MGYEEMAADGGYGRIGTPENRAMADHLEEVDQREMMEEQEPDPGDVWADLQRRAETAEFERNEWKEKYYILLENLTELLKGKVNEHD